MYQVYHLTAKTYIARVSSGTVLLKVYHILYQMPLNCTTYDYVSRFVLLNIYHNLQNVKFKLYHPNTALYYPGDSYTSHPGIHSRQFFSAIKKISICYSLSIVFKIYKNKKKGDDTPSKKIILFLSHLPLPSCPYTLF